MRHINTELVLHSLGFVAAVIVIVFGVGLAVREIGQYEGGITGFATRDTSKAIGCNPTEERCIYDCDDLNAAVYPGAKEYCDGIDNNCDGIVDDGCPTPHPQLSPENDIDTAIKRLVNFIRLSLEALN